MEQRVDPGLILERLNPLRPAMVDLLADLVAIESPSTDPVATRRVLHRLKKEFQRIGSRVRLSPVGASGGYLYARHGEKTEPPIQLVLGHADTVWPVGTVAERPWTVANGRGPLPFPATLDTIQAAAVKAALVQHEGNKTAAARQLGISRARLQRLLDRGED